LAERSVNLFACILGNTPEDQLREIEYAITGIPESAEQSTDWRTPAGSTFSPVPQGKTGSITFVYPGAFNSYPGVGQDLFKLIPYSIPAAFRNQRK
jgi:acyl transferase domain-containing protein